MLYRLFAALFYHSLFVDFVVNLFGVVVVIVDGWCVWEGVDLLFGVVEHYCSPNYVTFVV